VALAPVPVRPRRLVFLGTPAMAVPPLRALVDAGFDVALVVTRADKRRGRREEPTPSPVKAAAIELALPVSHRVDDALAAGADLGVVVAYGALVKPHVLAELPMVNLHFSLLPRWRGAAPVERALLAGDTETGVCVMQLEEGLDTGPVYACERVPIGPEDTLDDVRATLVTVGTDLLVRTLGDGLDHATPQTGEPVYAAKLSPDDLQLDWARPAVELDRIVRVGGAWTAFRGRRLKVLAATPVDGSLPPAVIERDRVGTGHGDLVVRTVQPEGKAPMPAAAWRNGARPRPGETFGE
jgi:methionyl-tRNA formyltransferase